MAGPSRLPSRVIRHRGDFTWAGLAPRLYKAAARHWRGVTRWELAGRGGEQTAFEVRYFEVEPGGYTSCERHEHEHVVVVLRGEGWVRLGEEEHALHFGDIVYVAPRDPHRFGAPPEAREPLGFLCIVDRERDRPEVLDP